MIPLKRVDHLSMAAPNWRNQSDWLERILGFKFIYYFPAGGGDFDGCVSQVPGTDIEFEVISPVGERSFVQKFMDEFGAGLHHITVEVEDVHAVARLMKDDLGIEPFGGVMNDGQWWVTYIHPKDSGGILWQLYTPLPHEPRQVDRTTGPGAVGLKRVDHVSMAVRDLDKQVAWQERVFGMKVEGSWEEDPLGYRGAVMSIPNSQLKFEMMEPTRPDSFVQRFIDERRQGMHHICCEVESVEAAVEGLRAEGIEAFGGVINSDWKKHTFIHPRDSGGVLFQLFEEREG